MLIWENIIKEKKYRTSNFLGDCCYNCFDNEEQAHNSMQAKIREVIMVFEWSGLKKKYSMLTDTPINTLITDIVASRCYILRKSCNIPLKLVGIKIHNEFKNKEVFDKLNSEYQVLNKKECMLITIC